MTSIQMVTHIPNTCEHLLLAQVVICVKNKLFLTCVSKE